MNKLNKILSLVFLFIPLSLLSQVNIKIYFDNQQDSVFYLHQYRGAKTTVVDTAYLKKGIIHFKKRINFPEGIYVLTNENDFPLTEILLGRDQKFSLIINELDNNNPIKVRGSKETENYIKLMDKIHQNDTNYNSLTIKRKDAYLNIVINSVKRCNMQNYWDNFKLDDKRILTYPLIDNKLETYFNSLPVDATIINKEIDKLIAKTGDCAEVRDYLIWYFYRKYYSPDYMNLDDIYIHLVEDYFMKYEMENVSEKVLKMMTDRANYLKNLKIGAKIPPIGNLHSIKSDYIALVFYDKTCHKCAQEGRILEEIHARHPEMTIFPVEINSSGIENLLFLYDIQTTPMIYLLDNEKKIIAKRIKAEQVEQFLNKD